MPMPQLSVPMREFIVEHIVARFPHFALRRLYPNHKLRKEIVFQVASPSGITINRKLAELDIVLTVRSGFPVELIRIDFTMTWNYTDYFTRINENLSKQVPCLNDVTLSFRKELTTDEVSRIKDGTLFLAGDAEFRTSFSEFTKVLDLQAVPAASQTS